MCLVTWSLYHSERCDINVKLKHLTRKMGCCMHYQCVSNSCYSLKCYCGNITVKTSYLTKQFKRNLNADNLSVLRIQSFTLTSVTATSSQTYDLHVFLSSVHKYHYSKEINPLFLFTIRRVKLVISRCLKHPEILPHLANVD